MFVVSSIVVLSYVNSGLTRSSTGRNSPIDVILKPGVTCPGVLKLHLTIGNRYYTVIFIVNDLFETLNVWFNKFLETVNSIYNLSNTMFRNF